MTWKTAMLEAVRRKRIVEGGGAVDLSGKENDVTLDEIESRISALEIEREEIETTLVDIRGQIGKSSADFHAGKPGRDPDWYGRAKTALRYHGADHQSVLRELGDLRRKAKELRHERLKAAEKPLSWYFYQLAEQEMAKRTFTKLFTKAVVMKQEAEA